MDGRDPINIPGNSFDFHFHTDGSVTKWGYKFIAKAFFPNPALQRAKSAPAAPTAFDRFQTSYAAWALSALFHSHDRDALCEQTVPQVLSLTARILKASPGVPVPAIQSLIIAASSILQQVLAEGSGSVSLQVLNELHKSVQGLFDAVMHTLAELRDEHPPASVGGGIPTVHESVRTMSALGTTASVMLDVLQSCLASQTASSATDAAASTAEESDTVLLGDSLPYPGTGVTRAKTVVLSQPVATDSHVTHLRIRLAPGGHRTTSMDIVVLVSKSRSTGPPRFKQVQQVSVPVDPAKVGEEIQVIKLVQPLEVQPGQYLGLYNKKGLFTVSGGAGGCPTFFSASGPALSSTKFTKLSGPLAPKEMGFCFELKPHVDTSTNESSDASDAPARSDKSLLELLRLLPVSNPSLRGVLTMDKREDLGASVPADSLKGVKAAMDTVQLASKTFETLRDLVAGRPPRNILEPGFLEQQQESTTIRIESARPLTMPTGQPVVIAEPAEAVSPLLELTRPPTTNQWMSIAAKNPTCVTGFDIAVNDAAQVPAGCELEVCPAGSDLQPIGEPKMMVSSTVLPPPQVFESPHPYANSTDETFVVRFTDGRC